MERGGDGGGELSQGGPPFRWGKAVWAALAHAERVAIVYSALLFVACVAIIAVETDRAYMGTGFTTRPWRAWWHAAYDALLLLFGFMTGISYAVLPASSTSAVAAALPWLWLFPCGVCMWALLKREASPILLAIHMGHWGKDDTCCERCKGTCCECCRPVRCSNCFQQTLRAFLFIFALGWFAQGMILLRDFNSFYLPPGDFAEVTAGYPEGRSAQLHYYCSGQKADPSQPTVLLEHGGGSGKASFLPLQAILDRSMRVCSYDRAGYGYSQSGMLPRTDAQNRGELLQVLEAAGETGPLVCAGHSAGGHKCLDLNKHTDRVKGVVLMDAYCNNGDCDIEKAWFDASDSPEAWYDGMRQSRLGLTDMLRWLQVLGLTSAIGTADFEGNGYFSYNYHQWRVWDAQFLEFRYALTHDWTDEELSIWKEANQTSTPVVVLGAGTNDACADRAELADDAEKCESFLETQLVTQGEMQMYAATSIDGEIIHCSDGCYHGFVWEKPEAPAEVISDLVAKVTSAS
eukprot:jgi/Tetstr1/421759/TSEL_012663.t1